MRPLHAHADRRAVRPFFGTLDTVIVEPPVEFEFQGSIHREHAAAAWTWMFRDLAADLIDPESPEDDPLTIKALDALVPDLLVRARAAMDKAGTSRDETRRFMTQLGGENEARRLPVVLTALRCRPLLEKAQAFGRAANGMTDEAALATALQGMPLTDKPVVSMLMHAAVGQVATPSRLVTAVIRLTGLATEYGIERAGFAPLVDAILAHAQNQIHPLLQVGPFADIDLICRAIDRFHRLARAINSHIELNRNSRWTVTLGGLTKTISERIEPRLREVVMDVNRSMRRREANDRVDSDQILTALNGVYVLTAVRDARDSLAVNAVFDQTWEQLGEALEIHLNRNLEMLKFDPANRVVAGRLDAAIKMAELRFNAEYAEVLRRAKEAAGR